MHHVLAPLFAHFDGAVKVRLFCWLCCWQTKDRETAANSGMQPQDLKDSFSGLLNQSQMYWLVARGGGCAVAIVGLLYKQDSDLLSLQ